MYTEPIYLRGFVAKINSKYKDDFPLDNFDNTQFEAEARKDVEMAVAWSNESIELWFLLHFQDYISDNGREQYIRILSEKFEYSKVREYQYRK